MGVLMLNVVCLSEVIILVVVCSKGIRSCGKGKLMLMVKRRMLKL